MSERTAKWIVLTVLVGSLIVLFIAAQTNGFPYNL